MGTSTNSPRHRNSSHWWPSRCNEHAGRGIEMVIARAVESGSWLRKDGLACVRRALLGSHRAAATGIVSSNAGRAKLQLSQESKTCGCMQDTGTSQHSRMARHGQSRLACVGWRSCVQPPTAIAPYHREPQVRKSSAKDGVVRSSVWLGGKRRRAMC